MGEEVPEAFRVNRQGTAREALHAEKQVRELTGPKRCFVPVTELVERMNQELRGWGGYFSYGHPHRAHRKVNAFVVSRLTRHLKRRSQRACRPPAGMTYCGFLTKRLGLELLQDGARNSPIANW